MQNLTLAIPKLFLKINLKNPMKLIYAITLEERGQVFLKKEKRRKEVKEKKAEVKNFKLIIITSSKRKKWKRKTSKYIKV